MRRSLACELSLVFTLLNSAGSEQAHLGTSSQLLKDGWLLTPSNRNISKLDPICLTCPALSTFLHCGYITQSDTRSIVQQYPNYCTPNLHHSHDTTQHGPIPHARLIGNHPPVPSSLSSATNYPEYSPLLSSRSNPHAGVPSSPPRTSSLWIISHRAYGE